MGKLYTLDGKLLTETPEVRVGEKIYPVDNRQKTVEKLRNMVATHSKKDSNAAVAEALELAMGKSAAAEIQEMNMPYPAYQKLFELVMAAMTGEEPEEMAARFQGEEAGK